MKSPVLANVTDPAGESANDSAAKAEKPVCGVIMPISSNGDYSEEHWRRVQRILIRAIERADMTAKMVWENPEIDVIHSKILQNIYESDVVICDVSSLNPNVMLELGLRLSTKRPTIVITDTVHKPPFDISVYQYYAYQRDLEYNSLDVFIDDISQKIRLVHEAYQQNRYKSFVENFTFEVVEPTEVTVSAEEALRERVETISRQLSRIEKGMAERERPTNRLRIASLELTPILSDSGVVACNKELRTHPDILKVEIDNSGFNTKARIWYDSTMPSKKIEDLKMWVASIVDKHDEVPF